MKSMANYKLSKGDTPFMKVAHYLRKVWIIVSILPMFIFWGRFAVALDKAPPDLIKKIAEAGDLTKYPDANTILIEMKTTYDYQLNGNYVSTTYALRKILREQGKKDFSESKFPYYRKYNRIYVNQAQIIKPDGTIQDVPKENITDITLAILASMNIYEPDQRQKVITFPNLEVGDAIEYFVVDSCHHAIMEGEFDCMYFFQEFNPVLHDEIVVTGPSSMPLTYKSQNDLEGKIQFSRIEKDGKITYRWWANDQPRIVSEPAMAPYLNIAPGIWASTIKSWRDMSRWGYHLNEQYIDMNEALRNETHQLVIGCKTRNDTLKALYHFVAQKVRYMGIGLGKKTGFDPKPATKTYETKYGVCRDVAVLLTAMLREVGIPANVVYTSAGYEQYADIPNLNWSHGIVAVPQKGYGYTYIDPTVENGMDLLMSVEAEQVTLVLTAQGDSLDKTAYSPPDDNTGYFKANTELKADGSVTSHIQLSSNGIYDLVLRQIVKAMPGVQLRNIFQDVVSSVYPGAQITDIKTGNPEDLYHPITVAISFESADFALQAGKYVLVKIPLSTGVFDLLGSQFLKAANLSERKHPFNLQTTLGVLNEETLTIPKGYRIKAIPEPVDITYDPVAYKMRYQETRIEEPEGKAAVQYRSWIRMKKKIYSPTEYLELKKILKASQRSTRGEVILEKTD
jgi:hypothetical protein